MEECGFRSGISSRQRVALRGTGVTEAPGWTLGVVDFLVYALGSLNTCHHPDAGQILNTTIFFPCFFPSLFMLRVILLC